MVDMHRKGGVLGDSPTETTNQRYAAEGHNLAMITEALGFP